MFRRWLRSRRRSIDIVTLWPKLRRLAAEHEITASGASLEAAQFAFYCHVCDDPAWNTDYSIEALHEFCMGLE